MDAILIFQNSNNHYRFSGLTHCMTDDSCGIDALISVHQMGNSHKVQNSYNVIATEPYLQRVPQEGRRPLPFVNVQASLCGCSLVAMWLCGYVGVSTRLGGCVAVWLCGYLAMWLGVCMVPWTRTRYFSVMNGFTFELCHCVTNPDLGCLEF